MRVLSIKRQLRRVSCFQWFIGSAIAINLLLYYYLSHRNQQLETMPLPVAGSRRYEEYLLIKSLGYDTPGLTIVIREFEFFDNRVADTVLHAHKMIPSADIVVVSDTVPYPPLNLPGYAKLVVLTVPLERSQIISRVDMYIKRRHVLFMPDAHQIISQDAVQVMVNELANQAADVKMIAWPANALRDVKCKGLDVKLKKWTMTFFRTKGPCDALHGAFFLLIKRADLFKLAQPFARPMSEAFFIQTAIRGWKVVYRNDFTFRRSVKLYQDPHYNWKHKSKEEARQLAVYKDFGIKLIQSEDGKEQWLGCTKETQRCFSTVLNDMPEYIFQGRWTPPCCLHNLRLTARHVFLILESNGVRYWLEGGSLLGAVRHGDIIPWDYDVDIGIYQDDIPKCMHLLKCDFQPFEDQDGFIWERATEGDFFRVQFSSTNRLHVDIFPFTSRNGTMTKKTWMKSHRQDTEFPEHYLEPLEKVDFVGVKAFVPNNYREFLEFKFGKGVIENPRYPDASKAV